MQAAGPRAKQPSHTAAICQLSGSLRSRVQASFCSDITPCLSHPSSVVITAHFYVSGCFNWQFQDPPVFCLLEHRNTPAPVLHIYHGCWSRDVIRPAPGETETGRGGGNGSSLEIRKLEKMFPLFQAGLLCLAAAGLSMPGLSSGGGSGPLAPCHGLCHLHCDA